MAMKIQTTLLLLLTTASLVGCSSTATKPESTTGDTATSPTVGSNAANNKAKVESPSKAATTKRPTVDGQNSTYAYLNYGYYDDPANLDFLSADTDAQCDTLFAPAATVDLAHQTNLPSQDQRGVKSVRPSTPTALLKLNPRGTTQKVSLPSGKLDLWCRIRKGYRLEVVDNDYIQRAIDRYVKFPQYFENMSLKARPYLYHIVAEIQQRGMPLELALLPAVESGFEPFAVSPKSAAGLWQFIPDTGRDYGLQQTEWYDGRRDIIASTHAALDYLQKLHETFGGDWLTALAAYNYGEGNIRKAIRKNEAQGRPTDFWSLDLPRETRWYVPKLLALAKIIANPQEYGIRLPTIADRPYLKQVAVKGQISLSLAAHLADIPTTDITRLNAGYRLGVTSPDGPQQLTLPIHKADLFKKRLAKTTLPSPMPVMTGGVQEISILVDNSAAFVTPVSSQSAWTMTKDVAVARPQVKTKQHIVNKGETLEQIAKLYNTSIVELRKLNRLDTDLVKAGTLLTVPAPANSNVSLNTQQTGMARAANQSANVPPSATTTTPPTKTVTLSNR